MAQGHNFFLRNTWYFALPSAAIKPGKTLAKILLNEPILFCRKQTGEVFAMRNVCPHRGMPLSCGRFDGQQVECCFHGWVFGSDGRCSHIPSLTGHEDITPENISVKTYPVAEQQGNIWIFMADQVKPVVEKPVIPVMPDVRHNGHANIVERMEFPCFIDQAAIGLVDPAHVPFVHASRLWRTPRSIHEKVKKFGPVPFGFRMLRHTPSSNSFAYKILGGKLETEITFLLPGIRIEHTRAGKHYVCNVTTVTPIDDKTTEVYHFIYWDVPLLSLLRPVLRPFVTNFLDQDRRMVVLQKDGLKYEQNMMLVRDADTLARWYLQLKNEYAKASNENRPFHNPVKETTLKWQS